MTQKNSENSYLNKVWIAVGITALVIIILLFLKQIFSVLLLILAAVLIAVYFRGLSAFIHKKTKWNKKLCLAISITATVLFLTGLFWLMGAKLQTQVDELTDTLPTTIENAKSKLSENPLGKKIVDFTNSDKAREKAKTISSTLFKSTFGILGDIFVILLIGVYFTISPGVYKNGIIKLVPESSRDKARDILDKLSDNLKKWLEGKLLSMLIVFILTAIGLLVLDIPMWLALAIIAGLFNFIPNIGPLISMIPAVLVALLQGTQPAAFVVGLYILVQLLESNIITPLIQEKLIKIPPALIIITQLTVGVLTGGWGIVLATPLMVIVMILVQELYIRKIEKDQ